MTGKVKRYTEVVVQSKSIDMLDWCTKNIVGYGRWVNRLTQLVNQNFYFDVEYDWYARGYDWYARGYMSGDSRVIFSFAREQDAIIFTLKWL